MARGLSRLKTIQVTGEVVDDSAEEEGEKEYDKYELESACCTLERAAEIQADPKMMAALKPYLEKKIKAVKSLQDLRDLGLKKYKEGK